MKSSPRPRVHFSFRSPFSWIAMTRLLRALPDAHERLEMIPYWEPDTQTADGMAEHGAALHYVPMSKAKHLYILQDTKRLAAAVGLSMAWPIDVDPWWEPSHLAWLRARQLGYGAAFYEAVVAARWQRGENISDPQVIGALAASIGLDASIAADAIADPAIRAEGVRCLVRAYEDDIFGVPYFRCGRERFWGADRLSLFVDELRRRGLTPAGVSAPEPLPDLDAIPEAARAQIGAYDTDAPGGCG